MEVAVIGLGYVGLPLATSLCAAGHTVVGFDLDETIVRSLRQGISHVQGVSLDNIKLANDQKTSWTNSIEDLRSSQVYIICVPTPLGEAGTPDLSHVTQAAKTIGAFLNPNNLVILESSTHPGTTEEIVAPLLEQASGLKAGSDFHLAYSPERIDPGNKYFELTNTPKIVGGITRESALAAADLYQSMGIHIVIAKGVREAELAKILENTYRHVNIALVNEMVKFCRPLGIDLWDAIRCAQTKPFGFEAFYPGPGVGGHCIPVDPQYLSHQVRLKLGRPFRFVELAQEINSSMPAYVVERIREELNLQGKSLARVRILLLGITYKKDIADLRETPASDVVRILREAGSELSYVDPFVDSWRVDGIAVPRLDLASATGFDVSVLLQDHSAFNDVDILSSGDIILDTRAVIEHPRVRRL